MKSIQTTSNQKKLFFKIGFMLILILLLMIPNALVQEMIYERQGLESAIKNEISSSWGPSQRIVGPILSIPYKYNVKVGEEKEIRETILTVLPETLNIEVDVSTEERKKSIYKCILYTADHNLKGSFLMPELKEFGDDLEEVLWDKAKIDIGFTSASSLQNTVNIEVEGRSYKMKSGASDSYLQETGIHAEVILDGEKKEIEFYSQLSINGSKSIKYVPIATNTTVNMNSSWDSPGFVGLPLPNDRKIVDGEGFTSNWKTTEYNRSFRGITKRGDFNFKNIPNFFGVDLVQTVGHYQKNMRSAKYALLIISLSFLIFFFFEILKGYKIHAVQYIFIGLALSIFYILLLSFSEHVGFDFAYLIASGSVVGLISWYSKYLLKNGTNVMMLSFILGGLYLYIYILLQMEEYALLVGSIGLFIVLGVVMYLSRNMNWYGATEPEPLIAEE